MRTWRGSVRFVLASLVACATAPSARAQLLIAAPPGEPSAVSHAELAYASGEGAPVTWLSLRLARGPVAVVAAVPEGALVEPALDAWFAALEVTASPNVLAAVLPSGCPSTTRFAHVSWPRDAGAPETALQLSSVQDVTAALDELGVSLTTKLPVAAGYVVWSWADAKEEQTTRTLRVLGGATPLTLAPGAAFPILVNAITRGAVSLPSEAETDQLGVTFMPGNPAQSDYRDRLRTWLAGRPEPLLEMRARTPLFDWSIYADTISLAPLVRSYALRAARELEGLDADVCTEQLRALRDADAPAAAACGEARDAELALRAAGSEQVTLQRFALSSRAGLEPESAQGGGEPAEPVLHAQHVDDHDCGGEPEPVTVVDPPARREPNSTGARDDSGESASETGTVTVTETTTPVEVGCGSSTESEQRDEVNESDDGCSSDTSSSSSSDDDTRTDTCSGDSSSGSSDTNDDSCSGDSSSGSGDTNDDSCSGDSSSSSSNSSDSSSGSGCSSDSSSGYDGDTCTASAAPGAERAQKSQASLHGATEGPKARAQKRKLKTSLWTLAFAAVIFPIRRRKRAL
ncbi:MAG TPA: hypothetical protein VHB79_17210 [Polyangiaceae bacterium]|nr:hypothetical protein [Polyangiaceae bacterium]